MKTIVLLALLFSVTAVRAENFGAACPDIASCIKVVSKITGEKYIYDVREIGGKGNATDNIELTKENADNLFSNLLNMNGLTRVPTGEKDTFRIMKVNEAKGSAIPSFEASYDHEPNLPNTWDIVRMEYKMMYPETVRPLENVIRTFANMGARIYGNDINGTLVIADTSMGLKGLYPLLRSNDKKMPEGHAKKKGDTKPNEEKKSESKN